MSYATISDVFKRYKPIRTLVGSEDQQVTSVDVSSIFITDAESVINSYISRRYVVPLTTPPSFITQIASDLSIFNMMVEKLPAVPDFFQPRYERAMKMLEMIRDGEMDISSATVVSTGDQEAWSNTMTYHPVMSPVINPLDQVPDHDRVDADLDDRSDDPGVDTSDCD